MHTNMNGSFTWSPDRCEIPPIEFCQERKTIYISKTKKANDNQV